MTDFLLEYDIVGAGLELEKMTPAQRQAAFDASIVTDLDEAPTELLVRTRQRVEQLIARSDTTSST